MEIEIPVSLTDDLLRFAFEMQVPVEVIVEQAIISFCWTPQSGTALSYWMTACFLPVNHSCR